MIRRTKRGRQQPPATGSTSASAAPSLAWMGHLYALLVVAGLAVACHVWFWCSAANTLHTLDRRSLRKVATPHPACTRMVGPFAMIWLLVAFGGVAGSAMRAFSLRPTRAVSASAGVALLLFAANGFCMPHVCLLEKQACAFDGWWLACSRGAWCPPQAGSALWAAICASGVDTFINSRLAQSRDFGIVQIGAHTGWEPDDPITGGFARLLRGLSARQRRRVHYTLVEASPHNFAELERSVAAHASLCDMRAVLAGGRRY